MKMTKSQIEVLAVLQEGPQRTEQLFARCSFAARTVRYAVKKLISAKLITRSPNLQDMRTYIVALTEEGKVVAF